MILIGYTRCSTCQKIKKKLDSKGFSFQFRDMIEYPPKEEELRSWIQSSNKELFQFLNTSGIKYRSLNMKERKNTMTEDELIALLCEEPMLIKRPILLDQKTYVGQEVDKYIDSK